MEWAGKMKDWGELCLDGNKCENRKKWVKKCFKKRELVGFFLQWRQQMHVALLQANLTNQATLSCSAWVKL